MRTIHWLLPLLHLSLMMGIAEAATIQQQLGEAVQNQDWVRAVWLVEQMLREDPGNQQLRSYRRELLELRRNDQRQNSSQIFGLLPTQLAPLPNPEIPEMPLGLKNYIYQERNGGYQDLLKRPLNHTPLVWTEFPVKIEIERGSEEWTSAVINALKIWDRYIPNRILVNSQEEADIRIEPGTHSFIREKVDEVAFETYYFDEEGRLRYRLTLWISDPEHLSRYYRNGFTQGQMETIALHELGHAFGLAGDSPYFEDLMFGSMDPRVRLARQITKRDLNTLYRLYQEPSYIGVQFPPSLQTTETILRLLNLRIR